MSPLSGSSDKRGGSYPVKGATASRHMKGNKMGLFHDVIGGVNPDDGFPDDFIDKLSSAYDEDFSGSTAKVQQLTDTLAEKENAISDMSNQLNTSKAANYDLLMATSGSTGSDTTVDEPETGTQKGTDSLFGEDD